MEICMRKESIEFSSNVWEEKNLSVMGEVHEGLCGSHRVVHTIKWLIYRHGYYWPTIMANCFQNAKGCEMCQLNGLIIQRTSIDLLANKQILVMQGMNYGSDWKNISYFL
ncbi:hypothetical protein MTR_1g012930 [Medicago truncatula]|uniref:Integrase zinc-binding domain-containing protein n=1 Tax=Medicago truncatula TaxID=3880 RepID=A0A072VP07_MEDTR|nr:hypothetical protein MTR_1g012930 [Medicago truncatula]